MKFFDLFSGIGGFRIGLERTGHICVGSCEIDKYARQIYAKNFGSEPRWKDVRDIIPKELPEFDILCAGFPCQSFSTVGTRMGFEDTRGTLFFEIVRIAREKQPSILFLENVKGLLSHDKGETFKIIIQTLDECGYDVSWQIINSKYFLPQNRERIYIIANLRGSGSRKILPLGEVSQGNNKSCERIETKKVKMNYKANTNANMKKRIQDRDATWTLTCNSNDFTITQNHRERILTPIEYERLQGFKDDWTEGVIDTQRYKMLGNAVTTNVIEYISRFYWTKKNL